MVQSNGRTPLLLVGENVFSALSKFGPSEEENYLTEAFVFLLKLFLERAPNSGIKLINQLSGLAPEAYFSNPESITISTQVTVDEGRPDIEIRDKQSILVYIEVKHDAPLGEGQLEYYLAKLQEAPTPDTSLVLLTRSRVSARETTLSREEYHHVCWYEIYNWLAKLDFQDEVCQYFISSFLHFLEEKKMSIEKVSWEYIQGVPALLNLTNMMEASITEVLPDAKHKRTTGWGWRGFNIDDSYFYGIRTKQPLLVVFENNLGTSPTYKHDLAVETVHFFSLSKEEQLECLVAFLQQASRGGSPKSS